MKKLIMALLVALLPMFASAQTTVELKVSTTSGMVTINGTDYAIDSVSYNEVSFGGTLKVALFHRNMNSGTQLHRAYFTYVNYQPYYNFMDGDNGDAPFSDTDLQAWLDNQGIVPNIWWQ